MIPTVGRIVRYMWRLKDDELVECAAIITHVWPAEPGPPNVVNLTVFLPDGHTTEATSVWLDESASPGEDTWHWPPKV